jgi:hypothetical protein
MSSSASSTPEVRPTTAAPTVDDHETGGRPWKAAPPGGLKLTLEPRADAVVLRLAGDLDLATAGRFLAAMAWLRRRHRRIIVVDTRQLDFIDLAGFRALDASLRGPDGCCDWRIVYVVGDVLARLEAHLAAARSHRAAAAAGSRQPPIQR